jgi:hypothetical protein
VNLKDRITIQIDKLIRWGHITSAQAENIDINVIVEIIKDEQCRDGVINDAILDVVDGTIEEL